MRISDWSSDVCSSDLATHPAFTLFNLFLRDRFRCQYCGSHNDLTFDHVIPRALGGRTTWENVATACAPCNLRKGGRTPAQAHMALAARPERPSSWELQENGRGFPPNFLHETDRKSTRLKSSHYCAHRMPSYA